MTMYSTKHEHAIFLPRPPPHFLLMHYRVFAVQTGAGVWEPMSQVLGNQHDTQVLNTTVFISHWITCTWLSRDKFDDVMIVMVTKLMTITAWLCMIAWQCSQFSQVGHCQLS